MAHPLDAQGLAHALGNLDQVFEVTMRQQHHLEPGPVRGQDLLPHAANGQDFAPQGDFAGHTYIVAHLAAREGRDQRGHDGHPRAGSVFGYRAFGHMDVDVGAVEHARVQPPGARVGPQVRQRGLGRLLHHLPHLAGDGQAPLALHEQHFHGHDFTARIGPGQGGGHAYFGALFGFVEEVFGRAQEPFHHTGRDAGGIPFALGLEASHLAAHAADFPLQFAHAGFVGVGPDDGAQRGFGEANFARLEAALFDLAWNEEAAGNLQFFLLHIAGKLDDLHAVGQRRGDGVQGVGRGDEEDLRQVVGDLQVMVREGRVLLGVQHFEQRGRGVAAKVRAQFVDFVQHENGVDRAGALHGLQDAARQRAHIGAAMAPDFGLVPHAAQGHAHELAPQGLGNGTPQGGLARARRPHEAQNGLPAAFGLERKHRDVLQNALLGPPQAIVLRVQHLGRVAQVQVVGSAFLPGQFQNPLDVIAQDAHLGRHGRQVAQPLDLAQSHLAGLVGQGLLLDALPQFPHLPAPQVALAQLVLNGLDLLAQVGLALKAVHLLLNAMLDLVFDAQDGDFARQPGDDLLQPGHGVGLGQKGADFREGRAFDRAGQGVGQQAGVFQMGNGTKGFRWPRCEFGHLTPQRPRLAGKGLDLWRGGVGRSVGQHARPHQEEGLGLQPLDHLEAPPALHQHTVPLVVVLLPGFSHDHLGAYGEEIFDRSGGLEHGVLLQQGQQGAAPAQREFHRAQGEGPPDDQRHDHAGVHGQVAQGQHGQRHQAIGVGLRIGDVLQFLRLGLKQAKGEGRAEDGRPTSVATQPQRERFEQGGHGRHLARPEEVGQNRRVSSMIPQPRPQRTAGTAGDALVLPSRREVTPKAPQAPRAKTAPFACIPRWA